MEVPDVDRVGGTEQHVPMVKDKTPLPSDRHCAPRHYAVSNVTPCTRRGCLSMTSINASMRSAAKHYSCRRHLLLLVASPILLCGRSHDSSRDMYEG